MIRSKELVLER